jgi:hypothetical protein
MTFVNVVGSFLAGSIFSGIVVRNQAFHVRRRYGVLFMIEAALLSFAAILMDFNGFSGTPPDRPIAAHDLQGGVVWVCQAIIACAAALQNSSFTIFSSAIVRSTHVTGMVADIGCILGQMMWYGDYRATWKLYVFVPLVISFSCGAIAGGFCAMTFGPPGLHIASAALFTASLGFVLLRVYNRMRNPKATPRTPLLPAN